jgi:hypothetical protein
MKINIIAFALGILGVSGFQLTAQNSLPSIAITGPPGGDRFHGTNALLNLTGRASARAGISEISCFINGSANGIAAQIRYNPSVETTNWSFRLDLANAPGAHPGTNRVYVYALDGHGHYSATNSRSYFYTVTNSLALQITGKGAVSGLRNGQVLNIGQGYAVTARPTNGWILESWTDSRGNVLSQNPAFPFVETADGTLIANFVSNPFPAFNGTYRGLFIDAADGVESTNSGYVIFAIGSQGAFSGRVVLGNTVHPVAGRLLLAPDFATGDETASADFHVGNGRFGILDVNLQLSLDTDFSDAGAGVLAGSVTAYTDSTEADMVWTAPLSAERSFHSTNAPMPGVFNITMEPVGFDPSLGPGGYSYGMVDVAKNGNALLAFNLADGSPRIAFSTALAHDQDFPFFVSLYGGRGVVLGWLTFTNNLRLFENVEVDVESSIAAWSKLPTPGRFYTNGFSTSSSLIVGSRYTPPGPGTNIWGGTNLFFQTNYDSTVNTEGTAVTFNPRNHALSVPGPNPTRLEIAFNPRTGFYAGSYVPIPGARKVAFTGSLMPTFKEGWGYFIETNQQTSSVTLWNSGNQ